MTQVKAVPEVAKSRAPPVPEGAPPQNMQVWLGPPSAPMPEVEGVPRSDHLQCEESGTQQDEFDANRSWNAREREREDILLRQRTRGTEVETIGSS